MRGDFITAEQFLSVCRNGHVDRTGSGCYVILVYGRRHVPRNLSKFAMGYIGQSINVISRLKDHLTGHGNRKVYADLEKGRRVMVQIIPCSTESLNDLERSLIAAFDRGKLYNRTAGGSKIRCNDGSDFVLADRSLCRAWTRTGVCMRRTVISYAEGPSPVMLVIDGVKTCRLENGTRISIDLEEGKHRVKAKRLGLLSGGRSVKVAEGCEVSIRGGRLKLSVSSFRRARSLDGISARTRDHRSEERLSCFMGEEVDDY